MNYVLIRNQITRSNDQCLGKEGYDLKTAKTKVNVLHKNGRFKRARIYKCPDCPMWHIARSRKEP